MIMLTAVLLPWAPIIGYLIWWHMRNAARIHKASEKPPEAS